MSKSRVSKPIIIAILLLLIAAAVTITVLQDTPNKHAMESCFDEGGIPLMESKDSNRMRQCLIK